MDQRTNPEALRRRWEELKKVNPKMRIRDAADVLQTPEMLLLLAGCGVEATRLNGNWGELVPRLTDVGHVMALTRNDYAIHEVKGVYENIEPSPQHILVLGEPMDLRIFPRSWSYGFAVRMQSARGILEGLQFFDRYGRAVHKIYLTDKSDRAAFEGLRQSFADRNAVDEIELPSPPERQSDHPDADIDIEKLRSGWERLQDTHDFYPLLKSCKVGREQAMRLIGSQWATRMPNSSLDTLLHKAVEHKTPFMTFVSSPGVVQIYTGRAYNIKRLDNWLNILDPEFNLHLREDAMASTWLVRKPSSDGIISSLEVYDEQGETIAIFYGKRKPGIPEDEQWRELLRSLPIEEEAYV